MKRVCRWSSSIKDGDYWRKREDDGRFDCDDSEFEFSREMFFCGAGGIFQGCSQFDDVSILYPFRFKGNAFLAVDKCSMCRGLIDHVYLSPPPVNNSLKEWGRGGEGRGEGVPRLNDFVG